MKKNLLFILLFLSYMVVWAQQPESHKMHAYTDSAGVLYWNRHMPFYLRISETPSDTGHLLKNPKQAQFTNPSYFNSEGTNYIRKRFAVDTATRKTAQPQVEILWDIQADGLAPESKLTFDTAVSYKQDGKQFYGPGLHIHMSSFDALSGVAGEFIAISGNVFKPYLLPITFSTGGEYTVLSYAVDNVGNVETVQQHNFTVDLSPPSSSHFFEGAVLNDIIAASTVVKLGSEVDYSGVKTVYYAVDNNSAYQAYNNKQIYTTSLQDGEHQIKYYAVDNVKNIEEVDSFTFYLDKLPPILASDILGDRFIVNDQIYFSGRTKLKLTAVDNKSGVKDVLYSVDSEEFSSYEQPFYLPSVPGLHIVRYYAIDHMGNRTVGDDFFKHKYYEYRHNVSKIYVDLTGPTLNYRILGPQFTKGDSLFVNNQTRVQIWGDDGESGMQYFSYSLNGAQAETKYSEPFGMERDGENMVEIFGYDNVNNRNRDMFSLTVDNQPPIVYINYSILPLGSRDGLEVFPPHTIVYLAATDEKVGARQIRYSLNGSVYKPYTGKIQGFKRNELNVLKVISTDMLLNEGTTEFRFWVE